MNDMNFPGHEPRDKPLILSDNKHPVQATRKEEIFSYSDEDVHKNYTTFKS